MKVSRRANMRKWLKAGQRKAKKMKPCSDGGMLSLLYGDLDKNGGHYQVEYIHDTRCHDDPFVVVYWAPKSFVREHGMAAVAMPYQLTEMEAA